MAITVTPDLTEISLCETADGWNDGTPTSDVVIQGTNSLGDQLKAVLGPVCAYTFGSPVDMTGKHIYIWMYCAGTVDTIANGGYRIYVETDGSNYGTWYVGGKDTHPAGGWICFIIDPASTPTVPVGTITPSSIAKIGVQFKTLTSVVGQAMNVFWDACRYGTGLTITSGATDQIGMEEIFAEDDNVSNKYGVIQKHSGVYVVQGWLTFGGTGSENVDVADESQVIVFPNNSFVSSSFYGITVLAGTGTVNFKLGTKTAGGRGISGCLIKSAGTPKFDFIATDTDIDKLQIYGTTFISADSIELPVYDGTNREAIDCAFQSCGEILADTFIITYSNFIGSSTQAVRIISSSHHITYCNFINCQRGFNATSTDTLSFTGMVFSGCTYDGYNSSGSAITINYDPNSSSSNGWNYDPAGDTITYQTSVNLIVRHVKSLNEPTEHVQCAIYRKSDMYQLMNKEADVDDDQNPTYKKATESCTQTGIVVIVRAREKGYLPFQIELTIPSGGLDVTAVWIEDSNYQP